MEEDEYWTSSRAATDEVQGGIGANHVRWHSGERNAGERFGPNKMDQMVGSIGFVNLRPSILNIIVGFDTTYMLFCFNIARPHRI